MENLKSRPKDLQLHLFNIIAVSIDMRKARPVIVITHQYKALNQAGAAHFLSKSRIRDPGARLTRQGACDFQ